MRAYANRWRDRSRGAKVADIALTATILVFIAALVVNAIADVRTTRRHQVDQQVMTKYLVTYAGGPAQFGKMAYVSVRHGHDIVCALLRHGNGGLCLRVVSTTARSRKITGEFTCIYAPPKPKGAPDSWKPPRAPKGQHWCPWHPKKVT